MCSYWLRTWRPHMYTPFAHAIIKTPYAFFAKITLCMYLLYGRVGPGQPSLIGASLSEPHCYVANRGKRNALWCVRTRNFSTLIKIPSACDRNFYQFVVNSPIVFPSSQLFGQFAWLRISQDASHFARRNLLAELVEQ